MIRVVAVIRIGALIAAGLAPVRDAGAAVTVTGIEEKGKVQVADGGLWEADAARRAKALKGLEDYLATGEAWITESITRQMERRLARTVEIAGLDKERQTRLKQAADAALKSAAAGWRKKAEDSLLEMSEKEREQSANQRVMMGFADPTTDPLQQSVWKEALAAVLTEEERKRIEEFNSRLRAKRASALAMIVIAGMDPLVGFTEVQRAKLQTFAEKRLLSLTGDWGDGGDEYSSINYQELLGQLKGIDSTEWGAILDAGQLKRWKSVSAEQLAGNRVYQQRRGSGRVSTLPEAADEIDAERLIASVLHREATAEKERARAIMDSKVELLCRVAMPAPETVSILRTAAKGAAEQLALASIDQFTQSVRGQFQNVKPADAAARLRQLSLPVFSSNRPPADPPLWTATVSRLLTAAQRDAWQAECAARDAWRFRGLTAMVMTEVDREITLQPEPAEKLQKKLEQLIRDYEQDFASFFSVNWHTQGYYATIPLAVLTDEEWEALFNKQQIEALKSGRMAQMQQYGEMLRRRHEQRVGRQSK